MAINILFVINLFIVVNCIIGGKNVKLIEAPYQVNYADICGGVLIHQKWALTTAHCGTKGTFIRLGSKHRLKGTKVQVRLHIVHPKYQNHHEFDYDVQLLKLYKTLIFDKLVKNLKICNGFCGADLKVYGWGYRKERGEYNDRLQRADISLVPIDQCQEVKEFWYNHTLTSTMFCAGGGDQDACQGDSGGPAVSSGTLIGLSSFGYGCGRRVPGVYTNVSQPVIRDWILFISGV